MKIVILGTRSFPNLVGGVEKHCKFLAINLVRLGCDVIVLTRKPYVDKNITEHQGVKARALPALKHKSLETLLHTFIGVFAALFYRPDVLHIQAIGPALFTPLARILGMKVVVTSHGSNYEHLKWGFFAKLVFHAGEFIGVKCANKVIVISERIAEEIRQKYHRETYVIPNGIVIPEAVGSAGALEQYGLSTKKYILFVGRYVPEKAVQDLMDAFTQAAIKDWKLVIVGRADYECPYSLGVRKKAEADNNIILTGFLDGLPLMELYSHAGIFVIPSRYEGLPIVLLEALSYGLMCIASDIPANRCVQLPSERYFAVGDIGELSNKLKEFIKKTLTPEEIRMQIDMLREKYDWDTIAKKTLDVYRSVVGDKQR